MLPRLPVEYLPPVAVVLGKLINIYSGDFPRTKANAIAPTGDTPPITFTFLYD
ncbi:hypothetical protein GCM10023310_13060 [Paenibacillus vulneris]